MRDPLFDPKAAKQTVSITLNSDLSAKAPGSPERAAWSSTVGAVMGLFCRGR